MSIQLLMLYFQAAAGPPAPPPGPGNPSKGILYTYLPTAQKTTTGELNGTVGI